MKRKPIIVVSVAVTLLAVGAGIGVNRLATQKPSPDHTGLTEPIPLVEIPAGEFMMGSPEDEEGREDNETPHPVKITYAFKMGKTEVTQKQWRAVMGTPIQQQRDKAQLEETGQLPSLKKRIENEAWTICNTPSRAIKKLCAEGVWKTIKYIAVGGRWPLDGEGDDYPMYYVSWDDATAFCNRLTELELMAGRLPSSMLYRLPTEAEWEYAAKGGSASKGFIYSGSNDLNEVGWHGGNSSNQAHPVGLNKPNELGLYDLSGNVAEWCYDWSGDYPSGHVADPRGPDGILWRAVRGGNCRDSSRSCRLANRDQYSPDMHRIGLGFRVCLGPSFPPQTIYTVTFDLKGEGIRAGGGALVQRVSHGLAAVAPELAPKKGLGLCGWSMDLNNVTWPMHINAVYYPIRDDLYIVVDIADGNVDKLPPPPPTC